MREAAEALRAELHRAEENLWKLSAALYLWECGEQADDWRLNHEMRMLRLPPCSQCDGTGMVVDPGPIGATFHHCYVCGGTGRQIARAVITGLTDSPTCSAPGAP